MNLNSEAFGSVLKLTPIQTNMTELELKGGLKILFSYKTPVACRWTNGLQSTYFKTEKKWSATTTRHINKWIVLSDDWTDRTIHVKPQEYFDSLVKGA